MAEKRRRGRWYWHCHACGQYVPRGQEQCDCGAAKKARSAKGKERSLRGFGGLAFGVGVVVLWLVLLWMVLREHAPPAPPQRRRGAVEEAAPHMTRTALDSRGPAPHTAA